jgi:hypothetical protein
VLGLISQQVLGRGARMQPNHKKWQPGDLVLHQADPKIHAMLMEVVEIKAGQARTAYLDRKLNSGANPEKSWHRVSELVDPAVYLKTDEFIHTLKHHLDARRSEGTHRLKANGQFSSTPPSLRGEGQRQL